MEAEWIEWLAKRLPPRPLLPLGLADDAALVRWPGGDVIATSDLLTDQVDFRLAEVDPRRVGRKALAVNLSDLAAMAAEPVAALVALALPHTGAMELAKKLYEGLLPLADQFNIALAGGDTNCWNGPLVLSVTALGRPGPQGPLCRSGARPGDRIVVTGALGGSLLGRHLDFTPRVRESLLLCRDYEVHAAIDVSDGLSLDVSHLATASGCGAELRTDAIPISPDAVQMAAGDGRSALDHALADGEDFELVLALPADAAAEAVARQPLDVPLTVIGRFVEEPGLWQVDPRGSRRPLAPRGFEHGRDS